MAGILTIIALVLICIVICCIAFAERKAHLLQDDQMTPEVPLDALRHQEAKRVREEELRVAYLRRLERRQDKAMLREIETRMRG